jgi:hypothetical protein
MKNIKNNKIAIALLFFLILSLVAIGYSSYLILNFIIKKNAGNDIDDDNLVGMFYILFGGFVVFELLIISLQQILKNTFIKWFAKLITFYIYIVGVYVLTTSNNKHMSSKFTTYGILLLTMSVAFGYNLTR